MKIVTSVYSVIKSKFLKALPALVFTLTLTGMSITYAENNGNLRNNLERDIEKLEPEVLGLRNVNELKKRRDALRLEKEELTGNIAGETKQKILKDLESLKLELIRLKPISELATKKRNLGQEKKVLMENIYKTDN